MLCPRTPIRGYAQLLLAALKTGVVLPTRASGAAANDCTGLYSWMVTRSVSHSGDEIDMALDGSTPAASEEEAAGAEDTYRLRVTDAVLSELTGIADDSDFSMALTVQSGGYLVSGLLIGIVEYFRGLAVLVRGASGATEEQALAAVAGLFDSLGQQQQARRERRLALLENEQAPVEPEDRVRPAYLHLRDASLIGPTGELTTVPYWRGRLDHVDAFWLGNLTVRSDG